MPQPRTPTSLLVQAGSFVTHPERAAARVNEPKLTEPLGNPPKHLSKPQRAAWRELARIIPLGVAGNADRWAVEMAAVLMVKFRTNTAKTAEIATLNSLLSRFGMTPADRSRVSAVPKGKADDPFSEFCPASA